MKPWIKAGLAGGILQIVFTIPTFAAIYLPSGIGGALSLCASCILLLLYPVPGLFEAYWSTESRTEWKLMLGGALAGFLATVLNSVVTLLFVVIGASSIRSYMEQSMPNEMELIHQLGLDFLYSTGGLVIQIGFALLFHIFTGVALSALGSLVYAGIKNKRQQSV